MFITDNIHHIILLIDTSTSTPYPFIDIFEPKTINKLAIVVKFRTHQ